MEQVIANGHAGLGSIYMLRHLEDESHSDLRDRAIEHWHRSLEFNPDQPRVRKLIARYKPNRGDPEDILLSDGRPR